MNKTSLEDKIRLLEQYLLLKMEERDWHGVADAAMDLREMEAVLQERRKSDYEVLNSNVDPVDSPLFSELKSRSGKD